MPSLSGRFAGLEEQLVPTDGIGSRLNPQSVQTLPVNLPTVPDTLEVPTFSDEQVNNVRGIGKAIGSIGDILGNPAVQKGLASVGIGLDPRGVGGVLGQFGISLAEDNARRSFREQLAGGTDPNQAEVAGLSSQGRLEELQAFRLQQQQDREAALAERAQVVSEGRLEIAQQSADTAQKNSEIRQQEIDEKIRSSQIKEGLAEEELALSELRTKFQNLRDAAAAQASRALAEDRKQGEIIDVNKQRLSLMEELTPKLEVTQANLERATKELEDLEASQSGIGASISRGISEAFGSGKVADNQSQALADKRLQVKSLEAQALEQQQMLQGLLRDFSEDVSGQSNFSPVNTSSSSSSRTPQNGRIPVARSLQDAKTMPDGIVFQVPDGQGGLMNVMNTNGVTRKVN